MVARYKHRHFAAWEINEVKIMLKYKDPVTGNFKFTQSAVAKHFKTSQATISRILNDDHRPVQPHRPPSAAVKARNEWLVAATKKIKEKHPTHHVKLYNTARDIAAALHNHANTKNGKWPPLVTRSVQRVLHAAGFTYKRKKTVVAYTQRHVDLRLAFAKAQLPLVIARSKLPSGYTRFCWCFMDEAKFQLYGHCQVRYEWVAPGAKVGNQVVTRCAGRDKLNVFIFIAYQKLFVFVNSTVITSQVYQQMVGKVKTFLRRHQLTLYADNASPHRSKCTQEWMEANGVNELKPPPLSPDLNPSEEVFAWLKRRVSNRFPRTTAELKKFIEEEGAAMPTETINNFVKSFETKVKRCFQQKGVPGNGVGK